MPALAPPRTVVAQDSTYDVEKLADKILMELRSAKKPVTIEHLMTEVGATRRPSALKTALWWLIDAGLAIITSDERIKASH